MRHVRWLVACAVLASCHTSDHDASPDAADGPPLALAWQNVTPIAWNVPGTYASAMAFDSSRGVAVLFGGILTQNPCCHFPLVATAGTWEWSATAWNQVIPATSPPARYGASLAFDSQRNVTVLFGGCVLQDNGTVCQTQGDTWEWDGSDWVQRMPSVSPPARVFEGLTYDTARGVTVLFGGCTSYYLLGGGCSTWAGDTWEWDGNNWTQPMPAGSPSARIGHQLVYDSGRQVTVLFGGCVPSTDLSGPNNPPNCTATASLQSDTWEWDGMSWTQRATGPVPGRYLYGMAYDSSRNVTVLFGGDIGAATRDSNPDANDSWEWNGVSWTQLSPAASPTAREEQAMAYDSMYSRTIMFGGGSDDTWVLPSASLP